MNSIYFHLIGGAAGDMLLSSLVNLGCPLAHLKKELTKLGIPFIVELKTIIYGHQKARKICFKEKDTRITSLSYQEAIRVIRKSRLKPATKQKAIAVYESLFEVERKIHNSQGRDFRFHHLGELDAILEICGFFVALDYLKAEKIFVSEFPLDKPAKATLELLKGKQVRPASFGYETVTPTAAALLKDVQQCDEHFSFEKSGIAYGDCGANDYLVAYLSNASLQPVACSLKPEACSLQPVALANGSQTTSFCPEACSQSIEKDTIIKIETNIDDMNPQVFESVFDMLYASGAKEVYLQQVLMKKTRPGFVLNVLCLKDDFIAIRDIIFSHTSTFGIRYQEYSRDKLPFTFIKKKTKLGLISYRVSKGSVKKEMPEYGECLKIAKRRKVPLVEVYRMIQ
ncbi:MAG: LarC family nickel insertion protein [Candidatus Omnitrophica bacterium]|nr:LarC family nickel insertion protein [Candidatus Omnitrophota bacterium]